MREFLERVLPGRSQPIVTLRDNVLDFCASPTARTVLLEGPIGSGKSTIARVIAILKRVAPLKPDKAKEFLADVAFSGANLIDLNAIPWYVELALTGLASELAETQLFGNARGAYTGAIERSGVFEHAMLGRRQRGEKIPEAAVLTGGVVFLDEIGDLSLTHQAKLLPVLSGGAFYRLGEEGNKEQALVFDGVLVAATWKRLVGRGFRADLLSRIATNRLSVPSLSDRSDDFGEVLSVIEAEARVRRIRGIDRIMLADGDVDRAYWQAQRAAIPALSEGDRRALANVDWASHGNLRGLTTAVDLILDRGVSAADVIPQIARVDLEPSESFADAAEALAHALLLREPNGTTLVKHVGDIEVDVRSRLQSKLRADENLRRLIVDRLQLDSRGVSAQISDLGRDRRGRA